FVPHHKKLLGIFLIGSPLNSCYSGMQLNQIHPSPLLACGEGVGGGVLVSHSTENRYIVLSRLVLKIVVMARGKSEEARARVKRV
ncbi:hypothetical protein QHH03_26125, partial [Aphanizomenon sp. 202]|nr:hypothetical protein [Aphanizomenon sp. 202]